MTPRSRVFSVPPGAPFLPTLAEALLSGALLRGRPLDSPDWADAIVYLPTRRAARAFAEVLNECGGGRAQLLPRIIPLGDADEAEFELAAASTEPVFEAAEALAPPIPPVERRLILARLIQRWAAEVDGGRLPLEPETPFRVPAGPADALSLAGDLEKLMDALTLEDVPWDDLATAVEIEFSHYFELTLKFVRIAAENWPKILEARGASDPGKRRNALISAEARRLRTEKPATPIIAAGSTGSIPSTAALLAAIAGLPNGAVVLPGLDLDLDEAGWQAIGDGRRSEGHPAPAHPQAMMRRLVTEYLAVTRSEVEVLGDASPRMQARGRLLSEALRPAETTEAWATMEPQARATLAEAGLDGVTLVDAADERDEALAIAIALRETLEAPGRTAALVTPDRSLAARVCAELARWKLEVEDSAGTPLADTSIGRLARLAADAAALDFHPARVLALLAHPLLRLGRRREEVERAAAALEIGVLRGPAPAAGLTGLREALGARRAEERRHVPRPRRRLTDQDWDLAADLLRRLAEAFADFTPAAAGQAELDLVGLSGAHRRTVGALRDPGDGELDDEGASQALEGLFDELDAADAGGFQGRFLDYPAFFASLARQRVVPPPARGRARVKILGLLEARLLSADRIVLGGLDEGVWPPRVETDAFLNRAMRAKVGLSAPEQRIGQTAHDFVQLLGAPDVVITRAQKRDGAPMVPSRFLQRLKALSGEAAWGKAAAAGEHYRRLARLLDQPPLAEPLRRPAPKVEPARFPRTLSVTEIETLVRDPYSIFARHVLKLEGLDPVAMAPTAAERGTIIHDILARFAKANPKALSTDAAAELLQHGQNAFAPLADSFPKLYAEWWPRFQRLAAAFLVWERERRGDLAEGGLRGLFAAADARGRDADGGRLRRPAARARDAGIALRADLGWTKAAQRAPARAAERGGAVARDARGRASGEARASAVALSFRRGDLPLAPLPEIRAQILRLRSPRAGQGVVARLRRRQRGGGGLGHVGRTSPRPGEDPAGPAPRRRSVGLGLGLG
jgi:ATP-dependent helicase/nuclease subunit B